MIPAVVNLPSGADIHALPLVAAAAYRQIAAQAEAIELLHLANYAATYPDDEFLHVEVASVLKMQPPQAKARLELATTLVERLPATMAAFRAG